MTGETLPGTCRRVKRSAEGNSSPNTSRQRSPPRMPVSQSWTSATFAFASSGTGVLPRSWQPFPAASARGGQVPLPPVGEQVLQGALEGDLHLPAGRLLDLRRVPFEDHDVERPQPARIRLNLDVPDAGLLEQEVQHLLDRPRPPRAQVVHFPRLA